MEFGVIIWRLSLSCGGAEGYATNLAIERHYLRSLPIGDWPFDMRQEGWSGGGGIGESEEDEVERAKTTQIQKTGEGGVGRKSVLQAVRNKSPGIHTRGHTDRRKMG